MISGLFEWGREAVCDGWGWGIRGKRGTCGLALGMMTSRERGDGCWRLLACLMLLGINHACSPACGA